MNRIKTIGFIYVMTDYNLELEINTDKQLFELKVGDYNALFKCK